MRFGLAVALLVLLPAGVLAEIRLKDATGYDVVLDKPALRIVSLAPHLTEVVYAAGAGEQLVGAVSYSDYPEQALSVPRVGSYDKVNVEALLSSKPDLVLAWLSGNGIETANRLRELGLTVFVSDPRTLESVAESLQQVGQLSGHNAHGEKAASQFMARLEYLRTTYAEQKPVSVYYQIWNEPLLTLNGEHLISDVVRLCGGRNSFADASPMVLRINVESVVRADPQVIIASGMDQARPEWLDEWRPWVSMQAVRENQLYFIPPDILQRHTPRIMDGASQMCDHLALARAHYSQLKE